jgi:hypothetical protein
MVDATAELLATVQEIHKLLRIIAEPAIAEHDKKARAELLKIVGDGAKKAQAVFLMDGNRTQAAIQKEAGINQGNLSILVKLLSEANLLSGDKKQPKLAIAIPPNFFEVDSE